jgi:hypothetical protein
MPKFIGKRNLIRAQIIGLEEFPIDVEKALLRSFIKKIEEHLEKNYITEKTYIELRSDCEIKLALLEMGIRTKKINCPECGKKTIAIINPTGIALFSCNNKAF